MKPADLTLRDGRVVQLRALAPNDEAEILQAFDRMSAEMRYMRFMSVVRELDPDRLRKRLAAFPETGIGIVATVPATDGYDIVGSAIAVYIDGRTNCEFAITVASAYAGAGLATQIMQTLIDQSRAQGVRQMEGHVLAQNQPMLGLARRLGFRVAAAPGDPGVRLCRMNLETLPDNGRGP